MPSICQPMVRGLIMRVTRLDNDCGDPIEGECSTVVSRGFVSVATTDNIEEPQVASQLAADGTYCYYDETEPLLNYVEATITLCQVDPEMFEMMTGAPLVIDGDGNAAGFITDHEQYGRASFALEVWSKVAAPRDGAACPPDGITRYGYFLMPWLSRASFGDLTIENAGINFTVTARSERGTPWGVGPYDVFLDSEGNPSPLLDPLSVSAHRLVAFTQLPPPEPMCGCQPLIIDSP